MSQGLSVSRLVKVDIVLSPLAPARRGFGILMVLGDSDVISVQERIKTYSGIEGVANDFGVNAPEYKAAQLYFGQSPKPQTLCIGRWARVATSALLKGAALSIAEQDLVSWKAITDGSFKVTIDGTEIIASALDFSAILNLNGAAAIIDAAISAKGSCIWNGSNFEFKSDTTGVTSTITFASATGAGTDISAKLKMTSSTGLAPVQGVAAEELVQAVANLANISNQWYGLSIASSVRPTNDTFIEVAQAIQSFTVSRIFGVTETDSRVLDSTFTDDLATAFKELGLTRSFTQYSQNEFAVNSFFGRAFSVNFAANRSTITMMFKQEPGVNAEDLSESQALTLENKRCNVFVKYDNETSIIQYGVMSGPAYFDEIHGLDWFQNAVQNSVYTLLYTSNTKIPQTNAGANQIVNTINGVCEEAVNNGLAAPGVWNQDGFGQIERGSYLKSGYYVYCQPIELQSQADREQRKAPPITVALKLAGAIHSVDVIVNVNR